MSSTPERAIALRPATAAPALRRSRLGTVFGRLAARLRAWHRRAVIRRDLATLPDHLLRDVGLSRADVEAEAVKPFWKL